MFKRKACATIEDSINAFLAELAIAGRARSTLELYRTLLTGLAKRLGSDHCVDSVSREEVLSYLQHLAELGDSQAYIILNSRVFKSWFHWLKDHRKIPESPIGDLKMAPLHRTAPHPFTADELQRLLTAATRPMEQLTLLLLLDCGLRASELANLRLEDLDVKENELRVTRGKGGKGRVLALNPKPKAALKAYLAERVSSDGYLWPEGWDRKKLSRMLDRLGHDAKVAPCHAHRFRHTWACLCLRSGIDPLAVKVLGGWASLQMVEYYVHAVEAERAVNVHRLHPLVTGLKTPSWRSRRTGTCH